MRFTFPNNLSRGVLHGLPALPDGYHIADIRDTPNGVRVDVYFRGARIFEFAAELHYVPEYIDPVGYRYAARAVTDVRSFNNPNKWVEYTDLPTLMQVMLAKHRIGV